jgi:hypothetical protein
MFRLGSLLFIPAYLSVVLYRPLASPNDDGNFIVMTGEGLLCVHATCDNVFKSL